MNPDHDHSISPANDGPGNAAYRGMKAMLADVTAKERGR